ncbi:MAG: O-antigen ligase family protein [Deltaproteobacteria bacterium]|nr:O-antigen ligase family protein [Deltaproteobacteria bacterium]
MVERLHLFALVALAALLGLFEGPAQVAAVLALLTTLATGRLRGFRLDLVDAGVLVWILAGVPGALDADSRLGSEQALRPLLALAYFLARTSIAGGDDALKKRMAFAFALALVVNGAYGWLQVLVIDPPIERWIIGRQRTQAIADPDAPGRLRMATGLYYNRIKLAHAGVVGLALLGVVAIDRDRRDRTKLARDLAAIVLLGGAVLLSLRRAAPLALLLAMLLVSLLLWRPRLVRASAIAAALGALVYVLSSQARARVETATLAFDERWAMYSAAWSMFRDHWLLGVGHGDYGATIAPYAPAALAAVQDQRDLFSNAHNLYLQVLAETGVVGFAGFTLAIGGALVRGLTRARRDRRESSVDALGDRFALLGLTTLLLIGLVHAALYQAPVALIFWALVGLAAGPAARRS